MLSGFQLWPQRLSRAAQEALVAQVLANAAAAPFFTPTMPRTGKPFSVAMTNFGPLGWVSDRAGGYRYQGRHPETDEAWPPIPEALLDLWAELSGYGAPPEACLVNLYRGGAKMGLHVDADEAAKDAPVLSVSLGDDAIFRLGGLQRGEPTTSFRLASGDVMMLAGAARAAYHGVDRIRANSSSLIPGGGRINLTLRRVTVPAGSVMPYG